MNYEMLKKSPVQFDELAHTYTLNNLPLSGITGVLKHYICPDKYDGISEAVLNAAAERGHEIHSQIQMIVDGFGYADTAPEVDEFFNQMSGTLFIASEYLVSDEQFFASAIDIVDENCNLYDVKTTATLDIEYLSWQLSVYAYLFELQNPDLKAGKLYGVWLRSGKCEIVEVKKIDAAIVADFLKTAINGAEWQNPFKVVETYKQFDLAQIAQVEQQITAFEKQLAELKEQEKQLKAGILEKMQENGVQKWEFDNLRFTVRRGGTRTTFDSAKFKDEHPDIYKQYSKQTTVADSLLITIKDC